MPINVFAQRNRNLIQNSLFELDILWSHVSSVIRATDLSIFHEFVPPPTGGGHQFLRAFLRAAEEDGLKVENNSISSTTRACLMNSFNFDERRLRRLRRDSVLYVHRVDGHGFRFAFVEYLDHARAYICSDCSLSRQIGLSARKARD
ncbi:hypothetical protein D4S03_07565 [bacterium]|nr:MAG: hypothetical protein D4S03_07565 [bacterium]